MAKSSLVDLRDENLKMLAVKKDSKNVNSIANEQRPRLKFLLPKLFNECTKQIVKQREGHNDR